MGLYAVRTVSDADELARLAPVWDALAGGVPFRGPTWLLTWWRHFGPTLAAKSRGAELFALAVEDDGRLVGLAPWYVERSRVGGNVVRPLGSGKVCSDYLTLLTASGNEAGVAAAVVEYLCTTARCEWDRIDFDSAVVADPALSTLFHEFERRGLTIDREPRANYWRVSLPDDWEAYLASLSKSHRKQLRRLATNVLDTPRAAWHTTGDVAEFDRDWSIFVELHQRRRQDLGEPGCFSDPTFAAFHEDVARQLLLRGELRLHHLALDGRPIAAEYHLGRGQTVFAYQSGVEPTALADEPGRLAAIAVVRKAIAAGFTTYDLLRGDEPYKAHWRAMPLATEQVTVIGPRAASRRRYALLGIARKVRRLLQSRLRRSTPVAPSQDAIPNATPTPVAVES